MLVAIKIFYHSILCFTTSALFDTMTPMATSPVTFLKETRDELKKVTWPTQQEVIRLTLLVIVLSLGVGLFIGGLDLIFAKVMQLLIK